MLPNEKKKQMRLSVLSMLRENGMPMKEPGDEDEEELLLASADEETEPKEAETQPPQKKKEKEEAEKRPPNLIPSGVKHMKGAFRRSRF